MPIAVTRVDLKLIHYFYPASFFFASTMTDSESTSTRQAIIDNYSLGWIRKI